MLCNDEGILKLQIKTVEAATFWHRCKPKNTKINHNLVSEVRCIQKNMCLCYVATQKLAAHNPCTSQTFKRITTQFHCVRMSHVLWSQVMSCDHTTCSVITTHVLWSQDKYCDHKTLPIIAKRVLWSQTSLVITSHDLWSQYVSCEDKTYCRIPIHVLWSQDKSYDHVIWLLVTRHVLRSQDVFCNHNTCLVITRHDSHILWSLMFCDHKTCLVSAPKKPPTCILDRIHACTISYSSTCMYYIYKTCVC